MAFINAHFPPFWRNLPRDLNHCVNYSFELIDIPMNLNLFYSKERNQYHSTLIMAQLIKHLPADGDKIIGITDADIYIPILTFLFGEAQLGGRVALVSTYRLKNQFYGLPADSNLLYERVLKEILHELGHTMGLIHCSDFECVMNSSTYVENIDLKFSRFCKSCQGILGIECEE